MSEQELPIRMGSPEERARVRAYFHEIEFDRDTIYSAKLFNGDDPDEEKWTELKSKISPALRIAIELFFRGEAVDVKEFRASCDAQAYDALAALRMIHERPGRPEQLVSSVWVYPLDGFVIVSDRFEDPEGTCLKVPEDVTFSALNKLTMQYLLMLPAARGGDALDLCGGCGVGALRLARTARTSASADLTPRAAFYADFNARLNGVEIASLCGDMYEPAGDRQFDVVAAHPPFIPSVGKSKVIFRDADAFGESIARRVIAELPRRLRVGGTALVSFGGWDGAKPLEVRVQEWLGHAAASFDIVLAEYSRRTIDEVAQNVRRVQPDVTVAAAQAFAQDLRTWGARQQVHGAVMLRRLAAPAAPAPLRLKAAADARGITVQQILDWRDAQRGADFPARVAAARPRGNAHLEMTARYAMRDGHLALADTTFATTRGILGRLAVDPWIAPRIMQCDGARSVAEIYAAGRDEGAFPDGFALTDFAGLVGLMLTRGFLEAAVPGPAR